VVISEINASMEIVVCDFVDKVFLQAKLNNRVSSIIFTIVVSYYACGHLTSNLGIEFAENYVNLIFLDCP